jgi:hypothetical protein
MKIISGGQTGVDRAGLDAAIELGLEYGGAVPKGRKTEYGPLPMRYSRMTELSNPNYPARTRKNVADADATLIFTFGTPDRGTALTIEIAKKCNKPFLHVDLQGLAEPNVVAAVTSWLRALKPQVLNVAGSRESTSAGIYARVRAILILVLKGNS